MAVADDNNNSNGNDNDNSNNSNNNDNGAGNDSSEADGGAAEGSPGSVPQAQVDADELLARQIQLAYDQEALEVRIFLISFLWLQHCYKASANIPSAFTTIPETPKAILLARAFFL